MVRKSYLSESMEIKIKKDGIHIPRELLKKLDLEDAEIIVKENYILVKPKSYSRKVKGIIKGSKISMERLESLQCSG